MKIGVGDLSEPACFPESDQLAISFLPSNSHGFRTDIAERLSARMPVRVYCPTLKGAAPGRPHIHKEKPDLVEGSGSKAMPCENK
jgi:hypothetical protein